MPPLYDYACGHCNFEKEVTHRITETPSIVCPECGGNMHRVIKTAPLAKFKGNGFWATDGRLDHLISKEPPIGHPSENDR